MSLLGIDIGTSGCKAAAFSEDGACLARAHREYPTLHPREGWAELDSREVWAKTREVMARVANATASDPITALCVSSLGEAAVPVNRAEGILDTSILSSDRRGDEYVAALRERYSDSDVYAINYNVPSAAYTFPKLAWLRDNRSDIYNRADHLLLWDGAVGYLLGCPPFVSYPSASRTLLFDTRRETWSQPLVEAAGLDLSKLPPCLPSGTVAGTVSDTAADELGLPRGVKVVVGGHDQCCNALGAGITQAGRAVDGIGSFECITPVYATPPESERMLAEGLNVEHHVVPGLYVSFLFNQAGSLVRWHRDTFATAERDTPDIFDRLNREMPDGPSRLLVLPYFEPSGAPWFVSDAGGVIAGLKMDSSRGEILKAIMESTTYYFAECLDRLTTLGIDTSEFIATGGGACSDAWLRIKASILGVPYHRPAFTECGLLGCAMLAGVATGVFADYSQATERFVQIERTFDPDRELHVMYRRRVELYAKLLPAVHDLLRELGGERGEGGGLRA